MHSSFYEPLAAQQIVFPDLETITALTQNRKRKNKAQEPLVTVHHHHHQDDEDDLNYHDTTYHSESNSNTHQPPKKKPGRKPATTEPTNKRTAQNRAAQRAFRERKEQYVRDLEKRVEMLEAMRKNDPLPHAAGASSTTSSSSSDDPSAISHLPHVESEALANENSTLRQRISELESENTILREMHFGFDFRAVMANNAAINAAGGVVGNPSTAALSMLSATSPQGTGTIPPNAINPALIPSSAANPALMAPISAAIQINHIYQNQSSSDSNPSSSSQQANNAGSATSASIPFSLSPSTTIVGTPPLDEIFSIFETPSITQDQDSLSLKDLPDPTPFMPSAIKSSPSPYTKGLDFSNLFGSPPPPASLGPSAAPSSGQTSSNMSSGMAQTGNSMMGLFNSQQTNTYNTGSSMNQSTGSSLQNSLFSTKDMEAFLMASDQTYPTLTGYGSTTMTDVQQAMQTPFADLLMGGYGSMMSSTNSSNPTSTNTTSAAALAAVAAAASTTNIAPTLPAPDTRTSTDSTTSRLDPAHITKVLTAASETARSKVTLCDALEEAKKVLADSQIIDELCEIFKTKAQCTEMRNLQNRILDACQAGDKETVMDLVDKVKEKKRMYLLRLKAGVTVLPTAAPTPFQE
ncbi:hypothetical protein HDV05_002081 [Chytridiales sp. JEL 0842]|nr:hypothetical protein HDV05_002081 [Chytridiales sp. JEL 0842]